MSENHTMSQIRHALHSMCSSVLKPMICRALHPMCSQLPNISRSITISAPRLVLTLSLMLASVGAWAQTRDGYYKFRNRSNTAYYLSVSNNNYNNNAATPYLLSSNASNKTGDDAIWAVYSYNNSKILVHATDGRIVVTHDATSGAQRVHLETIAVTNNNNQILFTQSTTNGYYRYKPNASNTNVYLNAYGGTGQPNDIGLYQNDNGGNWSRTNATAPTIAAPTISSSNRGRTVSLDCTNTYARIYYTTDGTNPTTSSTRYTGSFNITETKTIKARAYVGFIKADGTFEVVSQSDVTTQQVEVLTTPTTLTFANASPTVTPDGWGIQLPAVTLKANETTVTGRAINYSGTGCSVNNNGTVTGIQDAGATITASFAGDDTYAASSATYIITGTNHDALNETVIKDIAIAPATADLDLDGTQEYSIPASVTATIRTCEQYKEFACPTGTFYSYASNNNWQYTLTKPTVNENTGATVNLTRVNWTYSGGQGQYFQPTATNNKVTLTRTDQKTDHNQKFTITANATYGSADKTATAKVVILKTVVDLTALHAGDAINLGLGEAASVEGHYTWQPNYESAGAAYKKFTYTSANTNIATVDENGMVTAVGYGTTTITMQSIKIDGSTNTGVSCDITVNVMMPKLPTPTIKIRGNEVSFECDEPGVTFRYTTDGTDPTATTGTVWNGTVITNIAAGRTIKVIATKSGFAPSEVASDEMRTAHVVYLRLAGARGNRSGSSADNAVGTWADAFAKLGYGPNAAYLREQWRTHGADNNTRNLYNHTAFTNATYTSTVDNNIIYLVGDVTEAQFSTLMGTTKSDPTSEYNLMNGVISSGYFKPVTISGKYANSNSNPEKYARINLTAGNSYTLNEDMRFEYVEFYGNNGTTSTDFKLAYYDLEMGEGIITRNFMSTKDFSTYHHGYAQGVTNAAHFMFYGGLTCDKRFGTSPTGAYNFDYYLPHPSGYKITIRSGFFSTISPGGTQWANTTSLNGAMGSPNTPVKCTITVDIDHAWNDAHQVGVLGKTSNGNPDCDVAVVIAGTHEGAMYGDVDIIVKSGRIDRVVNGTFGANNFVTNHPADSYFGRANILIDPREPSSAEVANYPTKNSMVVIRELYGGGLGRFKSDSDKNNQSSTYFYGKSSVIINGGTFKSAIYASGAGGVNGVGDANHHTNDARLPYLNGTTLTYGTWAQYNAGNKLGITCHVGRPDINKPDFHTNDTQIEETIYLSDTKADIEIHGGVFGSATNPIEGIFGGGYGFVDTELINYTGTNGAKPNTRAGAIFAVAGETASSVTIDGDAEIYGNIYGAGRGDNRYKNARITYNGDDYTQLGQVSGNVELTIGGKAQIHGSVYGAGQGIEGFADMAKLYGNTTLTIGENAVITGTVFGGGQNGTVDKNNNQYGNTEVNIDGGQVTQDVYGGGALADVSGNTVVNLTAGQVDGDVYGGGLGRLAGGGKTAIAALVNGNATTTLNGTIIGGSIFGANNVNGTPKGHVLVDVKNTTAKATDGYHVAAVYGGGNLAAYVPINTNDYTEVVVENCDNSIEDVFGGGNAAAVPATEVTIWGGQIGRVFAGGNGSSAPANVTKNTHAIIHGGTINEVYGGSNSKGTIGGTITVDVAEQAFGSNAICPVNVTDLYGGGNMAASNAGRINIGKCTHVTNVYGGANKADITGTNPINLNINDGHVDNVFGGNNNSGNVGVGITVNVDWADGADASLKNVYGGGNQAAYTGSPVVNLKKGNVDNAIYGGGLGATAVVTGAPVVNVSGGSVPTVFGGGSLANTTGKTSVNISGGTVTSEVYGGGALANVGSTEVSLTGGTVHDVYGGGLGRLESGTSGQPDYLPAVAALVEGNTLVTLDGSVVTGQIFGANNLNGTPQGNTKVLVKHTTPRPGQGNGEYDVEAVYGGGNLAAYIPSNANLSTAVSEVYVESCDNSIEYVYGGGNAASSPATKVTIEGGFIKNVFGGGNGKTEDGAAVENPGADVGYLDFIYDDAHAYGKGTAVTNIYGGIIASVFGGSNTKGNIRESAEVFLEKGECPMDINEVYGAGNEAEMYGAGNLIIGCIPGLEQIFAGAKDADVYGDVSLTITNGKFGKVFGGNNRGGSLKGGITVNIEETGCAPVEIDELYGGGYEAAYSVYGYDNEGNAVENGVALYHDPVVNVRSFTKIGTIYGGGEGSSAVVYGNPVVNIEQVKGKFAGKTVDGNVVPDELGSIDYIYGGGNAANVVGNTTVNIATDENTEFVSEDEDVTKSGGTWQSVKTVEGANIKYNVYGGGNQADVTGKTNVKVGRD